MRKFIAFFLILIAHLSIGQDCQYDRFAKATDDSPDGKALTRAIDNDPKLVDVWEEMDKAGIREINEGMVNSWKLLSDLNDSKSWVKKSEEILRKFGSLPQNKREKLKEIYENIKLPGGRPSSPPFSLTKQIDGFGSVTIKYDRYGFPEFDSWVPSPKSSYKFNIPSPRPNDDFRAANKALQSKFSSQPDKFKWDGTSTWFEAKDSNGNWTKYTWHHHQDGKTIIPVPQNIHSTGVPGKTGFAHTGGEKMIEKDLIGVFDSPSLN